MVTHGVGVLDVCVMRLVYKEDIFVSITRKNKDCMLRLSMSKFQKINDGPKNSLKHEG